MSEITIIHQFGVIKPIYVAQFYKMLRYGVFLGILRLLTGSFYDLTVFMGANRQKLTNFKNLFFKCPQALYGID